MYNISDVVEMGQAHELVLTLQKEIPFQQDDIDPFTMPFEEYFDE